MVEHTELLTRIQIKILLEPIDQVRESTVTRKLIVIWI